MSHADHRLNCWVQLKKSVISALLIAVCMTGIADAKVVKNLNIPKNRKSPYRYKNGRGKSWVELAGIEPASEMNERTAFYMLSRVFVSGSSPTDRQV